MTRRGKGGERNSNNKKISYESVTQKRKNMRKEQQKKGFWAVPFE
jgi:hypothetical protein